MCVEISIQCKNEDPKLTTPNQSKILTCAVLAEGLHKDEIVLLGELLALLKGDCPTVLQVQLVPDEHNHHVCIGILSSLFQPPIRFRCGV